MEPQRNIYDFLLTIDAEFADKLRRLKVPDKQEPAADHIKGAITHDMADMRFVGDSFLLRGVTVGFDAASLDIHKEMHGRQQYATHNIDTSTEAIEVIAAVSRWEELAYHLLEDRQEDDGLRADGGTSTDRFGPDYYTLELPEDAFEGYREGPSGGLVIKQSPEQSEEFLDWMQAFLEANGRSVEPDTDHQECNDV